MDQNFQSYHDQDPTKMAPPRPPPPTMTPNSYQTPNLNQTPFSDIENQDTTYASSEPFSAFSDESIRLAFIRKVYSILSIQLIITFGFVSIFQLSNGSRAWAVMNPGWIYVGFIFGFGTLIALACCEGLRRAFPANFICLGIFTLAQSFMLGMVTSFYDTNVVWIAILMTLIVVIGLTAFSAQTQIDFTVCSSLVLIAGLIFFTFGIISIFVNVPVLQVLYSAIGTLLFSLYLIIDTQMIIGGRHKNNISPEEYIFASITLYTDILNIFLFILQLVERANRR